MAGCPWIHKRVGVGNGQITCTAVVRDMLSKIVHRASWLAAVLTVAATAYWIVIIVDGNYCWAAFGFAMGMAAPLGSGTLVLVLLPSAYLYLRDKQRRDLKIFCLAAGSILALVIEAVLVFCVIHQRGE